MFLFYYFKFNVHYYYIVLNNLLFVSQGLGNCLDDYPTELEVLSYPDLPAGAMYNADLQCRLQFNTTDETVKVCSKMHEICTHLWCWVNDECVTQLRPAAGGTNCGKHKVWNAVYFAKSMPQFKICTYLMLSVVPKSKMCSNWRSTASNWRTMGQLDRVQWMFAYVWWRSINRQSRMW